MLKKITMIIFASLSITSCATMFNSENQTISVTPTNPNDTPKAKITSSTGTYQATLPTVVTTSPSSYDDRVSIEIDDECYEPSKIYVGRKVTSSYWVNILNGVGFIVDYLTGAMWKYDDNMAVATKKSENCE